MQGISGKICSKLQLEKDDTIPLSGDAKRRLKTYP